MSKKILLISIVALGLIVIAGTTTTIRAEAPIPYFQYLPNYNWQLAEGVHEWRAWSEGTNTPFLYDNELSPATVTMTHYFNYGHPRERYGPIILDVDDTVLNWGATTIGSYSVMWTNIYAWTPCGTLTVNIQNAYDVYNSAQNCWLPTYYAFSNAGVGHPNTNNYIRADSFNTLGDQTYNRVGHASITLDLDLWAMVVITKTDQVDLSYTDTFTMTFTSLW